MTEFEFTGTLDQGRSTTPFTRTIEGESLKHATEKLYSQLGSEHSVTRGKITIEETEEL
ncbi:50S ribosomal protein L18Ae [Candidatus Nanosalina sp. VS9-1]|uniref:50S ribosomal protein L18Ae n=1 Tax=Candidatus Nanosalina sp. VS9-1 TaxID=3388566 RepID=UPI0039E1636B